MARAKTAPQFFLAWLMYSIPVHGAPPKSTGMTVYSLACGASPCLSANCES